MSGIYSTGINSSGVIKSSVSKTLSANNTSANVNIFQYTGAIDVRKIYAVCTRKGTLANMTNVTFNIYDGSTSTNIAAVGVASTMIAGGVIAKIATASATAVATIAGTAAALIGGFNAADVAELLSSDASIIAV
jgi:galactitol-specific phosphotransferase system IIB component